MDKHGQRHRLLSEAVRRLGDVLPVPEGISERAAHRLPPPESCLAVTMLGIGAMLVAITGHQPTTAFHQQQRRPAILAPGKFICRHRYPVQMRCMVRNSMPSRDSPVISNGRAPAPKQYRMKATRKQTMERRPNMGPLSRTARTTYPTAYRSEATAVHVVASVHVRVSMHPMERRMRDRLSSLSRLGHGGQRHHGRFHLLAAEPGQAGQFHAQLFRPLADQAARPSSCRAWRRPAPQRSAHAS